MPVIAPIVSVTEHTIVETTEYAVRDAFCWQAFHTERTWYKDARRWDPWVSELRCP